MMTVPELLVVRKLDTAEVYVFAYTDDKLTDLLRTFGRYASREDLSFNWLDAATASMKARESKHQESDKTS